MMKRTSNNIIENKISPSMMCADVFRLRHILRAFKKQNIESLHIDVMDGDFVKNVMLGTEYCKALKNESDIPLDIHLMVNRPEDKIDWFPIGKNDTVSVHVESEGDLLLAIAKIKEKGAKVSLAINPDTPINAVEKYINDISSVLIMTVYPGHAGQKLIPETLQKITDLRTYLDLKGKNNVDIEVDGNVSFKNAEIMKKAGANVFVAGTSSVFSKGNSISSGVRKLRSAINL